MLRIQHLNEEEEEAIRELCDEYKDIFYLEGDKLTFTNKIKHEINTGDSQPIHSRSYHYPVVHKDSSGIQKWRVVIDYRKLNEKTIDDRYPLPNITDLLDQLGKCQYFTTLDLASGFHQIEVEERDCQKQLSVLRMVIINLRECHLD